MKEKKEKLLPFSLAAFAVLVDQLTKALIVKVKPEMGIIKDVFGNSFFRIVHIRNKAIAFSIGDNFPDAVKLVLFIAVPVLVLAFLLWYYFSSDEFTRIQRWAAAGILGGGLGNIIDRSFRPDGVVDFIDVRFYGLFGMERWPTFNIADAAVVVCCFILLISILITPQKTKEKIQTDE